MFGHKGLPPVIWCKCNITHTLGHLMSDNTYFRSLVLIQNSNLTFSASASVSSTGKEVFLSKSVSPTFLVENLLPQHLLHSQGVDLQQQRSQPAQLHQHHHTQRVGHCREEVEGNWGGDLLGVAGCVCRDASAGGGVCSSSDVSQDTKTWYYCN